MAYTTINKSTDYFNTTLYNGTGSAGNVVTGTGFNADLTWIKRRNSSSSYMLYDKVRGVQKNLRTDTSAVENTGSTNNLNTWSSDGFTVGSSGYDNGNGGTFASWNWLAGGSSTTTPTGGTIATTVSANTTAGFSIFTYTGNGNAAHLAHGLGVAPDVVLIKGRTNADNWFMKHKSLNANQYVYLNDTGAVASGANVWSNTNPDATKIYVGTDGGVNGSGTTYVGYAFAEKTGYSKFGSYLGNNNADGTFVYTGFKPAFVMVKRTGGGTQSWGIVDNKRSNYNLISAMLNPNSSGAEGANNGMDLLSNGFKMRSSDGNSNGYADKHIYMAFAEAPLVGSNGVTAKAR